MLCTDFGGDVPATASTGTPAGCRRFPDPFTRVRACGDIAGVGDLVTPARPPRGYGGGAVVVLAKIAIRQAEQERQSPDRDRDPGAGGGFGHQAEAGSGVTRSMAAERR